jgi:hypothetical protein
MDKIVNGWGIGLYDGLYYVYDPSVEALGGKFLWKDGTTGHSATREDFEAHNASWTWLGYWSCEQDAEAAALRAPTIVKKVEPVVPAGLSPQAEMEYFKAVKRNIEDACEALGLADPTDVAYCEAVKQMRRMVVSYRQAATEAQDRLDRVRKALS